MKKKKKIKKNSILLKEIVPNVYTISFPTQYELCMSFVRIQEFYESPEFRGKYFTLEEFMDYWAREFGNGSFDYPKRWIGFNVPGKVLYDWLQLFTSFDFLRPKETVLIGELSKKLREYNIDNLMTNNTNKKLKDIYVIGCHRGGGSVKDVINHELAHAMYALYPEYKNTCDGILKEMNSTKNGKCLYDRTVLELKVMGYASNVINDEIQAYWSTGNKLGENNSGSFDKLKNNFKKFSRKLKAQMKKE